MPVEQDFEHRWICKFSEGLKHIAGENIRKTVMDGSQKLSSDSSRAEVIRWTKTAMERLEGAVDQEKQIQIMTGCACRYPRSALEAIRETYATTKDISIAHRMLQEQFVTFLKDSLKLDDDTVHQVVERGWGLAGILNGRTIVATKIPKSGNLAAYLAESDPEAKHRLYCHCPRIREAPDIEETIPLLYCYCGAGYYKAIWEEILQHTVCVKILQSVLKGDDVCRFELAL